MGTVKDTLVDRSQPDESKSYLIQCDDSSTKSIPISDIPFVTITSPVAIDSDDQDALLQAFLQLGNKIPYNHNGQFYKGYICC